MEIKRQKEEKKVEKKLAFNKEDTATEVQTILLALPPTYGLFLCLKGNYFIISDFQETILREQVEGLVEEEEDEEELAPNEKVDDVMVGAIASAEKKTERQRKRERADKIKVQNI